VIAAPGSYFNNTTHLCAPHCESVLSRIQAMGNTVKLGAILLLFSSEIANCQIFHMN